MWHWGLGALTSMIGVVGVSNGNPRALLLAPDRFRGLTYMGPGDTANGRSMAARRPSRSAGTPVMTKGQ